MAYATAAWGGVVYTTTNVITFMNTAGSTCTWGEQEALWAWCDDNATGSTLAAWQRQPTATGGSQYDNLQRAMAEIQQQCEPHYNVDNELRDAASRARALLESLLTASQLATLRADGYFDVIAPSGNRYRIYEGSHGNVALLDNRNHETRRYCGQPEGVPTADMMLAQKLQLEADEQGFLAVANLRPARIAA